MNEPSISIAIASEKAVPEQAVPEQQLRKKCALPQGNFYREYKNRRRAAMAPRAA